MIKKVVSMFTKLSKYNLMIEAFARVDKSISILNKVIICDNGTSFACNLMGCVVVSEYNLKYEQKPIQVIGTLPLTVCTDIIKNTTETWIEITFQKEIIVNTGRKTLRYPITNDQAHLSYIDMMRGYFNFLNSGGYKKNGASVNLNRMLLMLNTIKKVCPDKSKILNVEIDLYNDFDHEENEYSSFAGFYCKNKITNQHLTGVVKGVLRE